MHKNNTDKKINMKNITIDDLRKMDSPTLLSIIDYWKKYNKDSVLFANAELERRNWEIPNNLKNKNEEFCKINQFKDIEEGLSLLFNSKEFSSYREFFEIEKNKKFNKKIEKQIEINSIAIDPNKLISAGKAIKNIVNVILLTFFLVFLFGFVIFGSKDKNLVKISYYSIILIYFISSIIVISLIYKAGDYLENAVNKKLNHEINPQTLQETQG